MEPFLQKTAKYLLAEFAGGLDNLCIVLPNRRGGLFLRKYLAAEVGKATWAPAIFSIEDFISGISGLKEVENLHLIFELYGVHREIEGSNAQKLEEFLRWAPQLISDFNEIDRYLADAGELFSTLTEARAISLWNLDGQALTEFEKNYLRFFQSLHGYYVMLTERLLAKNQAYQGLGFRNAAENIESAKHSLPWSHVIFAGFNALTKAEEKIIGTLRKNGLATVLLDSDRYYLENNQQEAGDFLRAWIHQWPARESRWIFDDFATSGKHIEIIGSPDPVGQVKYCGHLLEELAMSGKANEQTAVVLLDEGLLIPLLNSIPAGIDSLNITAGLPLNQTPLASLFETVFQLHLHAEKFTYLTSRGIKKFYYKDVLKLLQHPYIHLMAQGPVKGNRFIFQETIDRIRLGHRIFIGMEDISTADAGLFSANLAFLDAMFAHWDKPADALACFKTMIGLLQWSETGAVGMEYLYAFSKIIHQFGNLLERFPSELKISGFYGLYQEVIKSTTLPFYGEPLKGVQLMGMLETRTLDFENLIILSCNEDLLPTGKVSQSFIPFDIKKSFDLPTYRHKDSVYAYHFYRLLQRAERVWILYNTEPDQLGGGERSRFLRQIASELPAYNSSITIHESVLSSPVDQSSLPEVISIPKTGDTVAALEEKAVSGFSASSLNAYRNCPLKFYYAEIAGIKEPEVLGDTIDPAVLGSAVHAALNRLYKPFTGQPLTVGNLTAMEKTSDGEVDDALKRKFKGSDITSGKNLLLVNVAKMMIRRFLQYEKDRIEELAGLGKNCTVAFLEQFVETSLNIPFNGKELTIRLKGFIDRVDKMDGWWKIIDYKTGNAGSKNVKLTDWEELAINPDLNIGFQLLVYTYLLSCRFHDNVPASAGFIPLKTLGSGFTPVSVPGEDPAKPTSVMNQATNLRFEQVVRAILTEIYDLDSPFTQTGDLKVCQRCPYLNLCGR